MAGCRALIRVWVPDRPGALGLVASRIGALKGDIVGIEVLDRSDGIALDELAVVLPDARLIPAVSREIAEVDGAVAESVTIVEAFPEPRLDTVDAAIALTEAPDAAALAAILVARADEILRPDWCAIVGAGTTMIASDGALVDPSEAASRATFSVAIGVTGAVLHVGSERPFRPGEQRLVAGYCELAANLWARLPHLLRDEH